MEKPKYKMNLSVIDMLREIEAYLTFRLISDKPSIPLQDMKQMKNDIGECLKRNV